MAWQVSKRVWNFIKTNKKVKQGERLMLLALADIANEHGICSPKFDTSYATLGEMVGVNRRSAIRIIDDLCVAGHVIKIDTVGRGNSNIYVVTAGLTEAEIKDALSVIGVTGDTNSKKEIGEDEKEKVLPITPPSVTHNTFFDLKGVTHNTHPIKSPSTPSLSSKDDSGGPPANDKSGPKNKASPPPGVQVYRSVANRFPDKATWEMIDSKVGGAKEDLDFWRLVIRDYIASGFNKTNIKTMLEYFERRELPKTRQGKKGSGQSGQRPARANEPGIIAAAQRAARDAGGATLDPGSDRDGGAGPPTSGILSGN